MALPFVIIHLDGPPRGKGRPRTRVIGKFATIYTDGKTRRYEASLRAAGQAAMKGKIPVGLIPLSVRLLAYMPIPKSWPKYRHAAALQGAEWPIGKPDIDNLVKVVDALNGVVWEDDSQIVNLQAVKIYSDNPRLQVEVFRW